MIEPIFKKDDYIVNHYSGDLAIIKGISKKGYYQFKVYYDAMFGTFKNLKEINYELQVNYQKFFDLCTDEEKKTLDDLIKEKGEN